MYKSNKKKIQLIHNHDLHPMNQITLIYQMQKNYNYKEPTQTLEISKL